jgi:hypothetical protein
MLGDNKNLQATWRNYGGTITLVMDEVRMNAGEKLMDIMKMKTQQSLMSGRDRLAIDLFLSTQDSKKVAALPILVDSAGGTVQDISDSTNTLDTCHGVLTLAVTGNA